MRLLRFGCIAASLLPLIPVLLMAAVLAMALSAFGLLPKGLDEAVKGGEHFAVSVVVNVELGSVASLQSVSAKVINLTTPKDEGVLGDLVPLDAKVTLRQSADSELTAQAAATRAFAILAGHLDGPLNLIPVPGHVLRLTVLLLPTTGAEPLLSATVSRPDLDAWRAGELSDTAFVARWSAK